MSEGYSFHGGFRSGDDGYVPRDGGSELGRIFFGGEYSRKQRPHNGFGSSSGGFGGGSNSKVEPERNTGYGGYLPGRILAYVAVPDFDEARF
uniref:Uncharacterized protein n=1 Tax=Trichuris muris TaxID=70415 RepID=A0A5S6QDW7_TRIMR